LPLAQAVGERLPVADGSVDALLAECSLSVTMDVELVLRECYRVLRGGGRLVVSDIYARDPQGVPALRRLPLGCCLAGAMSRRELAGKLEDSGFHIVLWEDHSGALRNFAVQLILAHGSMEEFWCQTTSGSADPAQIQQAIALSRPGYFLLIAGKNARR
jgi:arsenite methyltransferase